MSSSFIATEKPLINAETLADILGCSTSHVWNLLSSGQLPPSVKIGRLRRWRTQEVYAWIDAGCPPQRNWLNNE